MFLSCHVPISYSANDSVSPMVCVPAAGCTRDIMNTASLTHLLFFCSCSLSPTFPCCHVLCLMCSFNGYLLPSLSSLHDTLCCCLIPVVVMLYPAFPTRTSPYVSCIPVPYCLPSHQGLYSLCHVYSKWKCSRTTMKKQMLIDVPAKILIPLACFVVVNSFFFSFIYSDIPFSSLHPCPPALSSFTRHL